MTGPTRAELLERCKAAGLKATGWNKERMAEELAKLGASPGEGAEAEVLDDEDDEKPSSAGSSKSGWCANAPTWGRAHLDCPVPGCGCVCHEDGWVRPAIPEGAQLSKYNRIDREALGQPWEPLPGERLADAQKLAQGAL